MMKDNILPPGYRQKDIDTSRGKNMKRNRIIIGLCVTALAVFLTLMVLPGALPSGGSRYSRQVEEDLFSLDTGRLNGTISEPFSLEEGDTIDVRIARISGDFSITIGRENRAPIYEGRNPELGFFRVTVPEDGEYCLSVSGKRAVGSISFHINRASDGHQSIAYRSAHCGGFRAIA